MAHVPITRAQPAECARMPDGTWRSIDPDHPARWEVICTECGDDQGPIEDQTPFVRDLRGAYRSEEAALQAATVHAAGRHS